MNYTDQQKAEIVTRHQNGETVQSLCGEYHISRSTFYRWAEVFRIANPEEPQKFTFKEYYQLQHEVERLSNIISVMKSVDCTVFSPLKEKLAALEQLYG